MILYLARDIPAFVMYCVYEASCSSLLIQSFRQIADHVNLFARLRHFQAREKRLLMVSDGARKTQAVVRMYNNSVFLGDTTFRKGLF